MAELLLEQQKKVRKPLLWIGMASIVMTFAGLTSGYVVSRTALMAENRWFQFELPVLFYSATVAILVASALLVWAQLGAKKGSISQVKTGVGLALLSGLVFVVLQLLGWNQLMESGFYFTGPQSNSSVSWVYVITFLHWLHVVSGIVVLVVTYLQASKNAYSKENYLGLELACIYWHFLDLLWIYLFCFLLFIR